MSDLKSNIFAYGLYRSILPEFLRKAKWLLKLYDFVSIAKQLFLRMISQEAGQVTLQ